jgi:putative YpdA family bacillithiol system oxidoreductase
MGLIKTAINEGKLVMDHLRRRIETEGRDSAGDDGGVDVLIVGSGPAGLSAALSAHQFGLKYLVLEAGEIAATIRQYPRHKFLMSEPVSMPLYGNLYVADGSKDALLTVWETIISNTGVRIQTNERVTGVKRNGGNFLVSTPAREYQARHVVLAMGKRGTPRRLGVPGEDRSKVSYRLIEAETYEGKDVLVVGGGDSAVEAALALTRDGRNRVTVSYRGSTFQRARDRNQTRLQEAEQQRNVRVLRNSHVIEIGESTVRLNADGKEMEIPNDFVFVLIGGESPEEFLKKTGVEIVEKAIATWSFS